MRIDLNQILARDDYKRMTENLKSVTEEVAEKIRKKMDELDIYNDTDFDNGEIGFGTVVVRSESVRSNSGFTREFLAIKRVDEKGGFTTWCSLNDIEGSYYFCGDLNAKIYGASKKEALAFLNVARQLIIELGKVEQKKADEIQQTIDNYRKK
jgi:hypothetical protein